MRKLYLFLAIAGLCLPYHFFVSFLVANGLDLPLLLRQLFANDIVDPAVDRRASPFLTYLLPRRYPRFTFVPYNVWKQLGWRS